MTEPPQSHHADGVPLPPSYAAPPTEPAPQAPAIPPPPAPGFSPAPGYPPQPGYGPPPGYAGYAPVYKNPAEAKNMLNILSLALSLSGLIFGITAIAGVVLGHLGIKAADRGEANNRGMGLAGLIVGYVLIGLGLLFWIVYIGFFVLVAAGAASSSYLL